jgi:hypothetical protein
VKSHTGNIVVSPDGELVISSSAWRPGAVKPNNFGLFLWNLPSPKTAKVVRPSPNLFSGARTEDSGKDGNLARKTEEPTEIDFRDVPAELQKIAELAKTDVLRARAQKEAAVVSAEAVDLAEIKLIEALVKAFQAAKRDADAVKQLEQLVAIRRRHVDHVDALTKSGVAAAEEGTTAREKLLEAEYRLRQAREGK